MYSKLRNGVSGWIEFDFLNTADRKRQKLLDQTYINNRCRSPYHLPATSANARLIRALPAMQFDETPVSPRKPSCSLACRCLVIRTLSQASPGNVKTFTLSSLADAIHSTSCKRLSEAIRFFYVFSGAFSSETETLMS